MNCVKLFTHVYLESEQTRRKIGNVYISLPISEWIHIFGLRLAALFVDTEWPATTDSKKILTPSPFDETYNN